MKLIEALRGWRHPEHGELRPQALSDTKQRARDLERRIKELERYAAIITIHLRPRKK